MFCSKAALYNIAWALYNKESPHIVHAVCSVLASLLLRNVALPAGRDVVPLCKGIIARVDGPLMLGDALDVVGKLFAVDRFDERKDQVETGSDLLLFLRT